jgi:hypothetical protein
MTKLTDPDIATTPSIVTPLQRSLESFNPAQPAEWSREAKSTVRGGLGGDPVPGIDMEGAPTPDPRYNSTAVEYVPKPSNLPMTVSAAQIARESLERSYNMGPASSEADAPMLAGTKVVGSFDDLRRRGGG